MLPILLIDVALLPLRQHSERSPRTRNEHVPWNEPGQGLGFIGSSIMSLLKEIPLQKEKSPRDPYVKPAILFQFD